jgi:hypothetical protein
MNTDVGFTLMIFNPQQGRRLVVNSSMAGIFGMHREEYLASAAARDLTVPMTELDGRLVLLYISVRDSFGDGSPMEVYFRVRGGQGPTLLCIRTVAAIEAGRVRDVRIPNPRLSSPPDGSYHCTPAERCAQRPSAASAVDVPRGRPGRVCRRPASCPLRTLGDACDGHVPGRRILADFADDDAWTLAALACTPAGARYLASLALLRCCSRQQLPARVGRWS